MICLLSLGEQLHFFFSSTLPTFRDSDFDWSLSLALKKLLLSLSVLGSMT
jgi:hypothetical protein